MDDVTAQEERNHCQSEITEQAFRAMPEEGLIRCIDAFAHTGGGHKRRLADFRNELTQRGIEQQSQRLEGLTETLVVLTHRLHRLTVWVVVLTIVLIVLEVLRIAGIVH